MSNAQIANLIKRPAFATAIEGLALGDAEQERRVAQQLRIALPTLRTAVRAFDSERGVTRVSLASAGSDGTLELRFIELTAPAKAMEPRPEQEQRLISGGVQLVKLLNMTALCHEAATNLKLTNEAKALEGVGRDILRLGGMLNNLPIAAFPHSVTPLLAAAVDGNVSSVHLPPQIASFVQTLGAEWTAQQARGSLFPSPESPGKFLATGAAEMWPPEDYGSRYGATGFGRQPNPDPNALLRGVAAFATQSAGLAAQMRKVLVSEKPSHLTKMQVFILREATLGMTGVQGRQILESRTKDPSEARRASMDLPIVGARALKLEFGRTAQLVLRAVAAPAARSLALQLASQPSEWSAIDVRSATAVNQLTGVLWTTLLRTQGNLSAVTKGPQSVKAGMEAYRLTVASGLPLNLSGPTEHRMFPARSATAFMKATFETPTEVLAANVPDATLA